MSLLERLRGWGPGRARPAGQVARAPMSEAELAALLDDGEALLAAGDAAAAIEHFESIIDRCPDAARAYLGAARACGQAGDPESAADHCRLAIHHQPTLAAAYQELAGLLKAAARLPEAITVYQDAVARLPDCTPLMANLGLALAQGGRLEEALAACDRALASDPRCAAAWHNRGYVRLHAGDPAGAHDDLVQALRISPDQLATSACLAHALRDLGRFDQAIAAYHAILARDPGNEDVIANLAATELLLGRFGPGWHDYAKRFGLAPGAADRGFPFPAWRGESLAGRSLFVYAEQGLGDEIMFASCLPDVLASAGTCVVECNTRLAGLFRRSFPSAWVHGGEKSGPKDWLAHAPRIDVQCPIGSLPRWLRPDLPAFPARTGYLRADPSLVAAMRARLSRHGPGPWIGISWRGGTPEARGAVRSLPLRDLLPAVAVGGARLVSLQHGDVLAEESEVARANGIPILRIDDVPRDLEQLAAAITVLDLVVSVDNTNVHLSGALGRPVLVLLAFVPEWRYGAAGETMPWYPSARLLRQDRPGQWAGALDRLRATLSGWRAQRHG